MFETDSFYWLEQFHNFNQIPLGFKLARGEEGTEALVRSYSKRQTGAHTRTEGFYAEGMHIDGSRFQYLALS